MRSIGFRNTLASIWGLGRPCSASVLGSFGFRGRWNTRDTVRQSRPPRSRLWLVDRISIDPCLSVYEVKNNCPFFESLFKVTKSGVFFFGKSFFVLEIFAFLCYANEESDDVIDRSTKTIKYWIENIYRNIGAVIFRLCTRTVHQKRNKMTPAILLPWQQPWFQSLSV